MDDEKSYRELIVYCTTSNRPSSENDLPAPSRKALKIINEIRKYVDESDSVKFDILFLVAREIIRNG